MEKIGAITDDCKSNTHIKILIVDDHVFIRKGIMAVLQNHDSSWELYEAEDGVRAVVVAEEIDPDIILLDYHMPKMDGVKAANILKKASPHSRIIVVSMDSSPEMIIEMIYPKIIL